MISDLRYIDPASLSGGMQTRHILADIGTPEPVIDWILQTVRDQRIETKILQKELDQVHLDTAE
jgi:hypothetical protein